MALINCEECGKEFSDKALACPNCAFPNENKDNDKEKIESVDDIKCPVKIKGDETLGRQSLGKIGKFMFISFILLIIFLIFSISSSAKSSEEDASAIISVTIMLFLTYVVIHFIVYLIYNITPMAYYKRNKAKKIYQYFKLNYPLLKEMKEHYKILDVTNIKGKNKDIMLFKIYMKAYNLNADGIVLTSDITSSQTYGHVNRTSGFVTSENQHNITATIIKY